MTRREFIHGAMLAGGASLALTVPPAQDDAPAGAVAATSPKPGALPDLQPAQWVWYPSGRCLPNTFVLFRKELEVAQKPVRARGWIVADSRYRLTVNGERVQWGPAPCDPRWMEADPVDLGALLKPGKNVIGATVLFYGQGDGTSPMGKAGFLFWLELEWSDGRKAKVVSNETWQCCLAVAWPPGHYKRWYLRALQEEFDSRLYPHGWDAAGYAVGEDWLPAMPLGGSPNKPSVCTHYSEYQLDIGGNPGVAELRPRSIPLMVETLVAVKGLAESAWVKWRRPPREYFECRVPGAYREERSPSARALGQGSWQVDLPAAGGEAKETGAVLTFEFDEQGVGWPYFTIEAAAGTVVEALVHEAHQPGGPVLLNTHFDAWTRFICRGGQERFETFDFESCRWLQLHIHGAAGRVVVSAVGLRRRVYPWPNRPVIQVREPALQRLFSAAVNTLDNCAQETLADGMGRERQQYSGDCGHQLHAIYAAFGERRLPARYLATFSQGLTVDGYFLDCWPAYDRLARLMERQLQLTSWGPLLDHGVGFNFDCWHHYLYTGDLDALREPFPRLLKFAHYLMGLVERNGLLPVENLGIPSVWIDHHAYLKTRHKQCAFNLYAAAMFKHALAPICLALGEAEREKAFVHFGRDLQAGAIRHFWSVEQDLFVNNLPWLAEEKQPRLCDRSLATALLFNQCPRGHNQAALDALVACPPMMGFSYPANAGWRLWALARGGRTDVVIKDLRTRWASMDSVRLNHTLQEDWQAQPDSGAQWSHCPVAPLFVAFMNLAGIQPLEPGFRRCEIRPQLADLEQLQLVAHTAPGPLGFKAQGPLGNRELTVELPAGCEAELVVPAGEELPLPKLPVKSNAALGRYSLAAGQRHTFRLKKV